MIQVQNGDGKKLNEQATWCGGYHHATIQRRLESQGDAHPLQIKLMKRRAGTHCCMQEQETSLFVCLS